MGVRRKRIKPEQPQQLWEELGRLPIDTEPALILTAARGKEVEPSELLPVFQAHPRPQSGRVYVLRVRSPRSGDPQQLCYGIHPSYTTRGSPRALVGVPQIEFQESDPKATRCC